MFPKEFKVATFLTTEKVSLSKILVNGSWRYLADPAAPLFYDLELLLNTSVKLVEAFGYTGRAVNGTFPTGIGSQVLKGEADICGDSSSFTPERSKVFDFLHPTHAESFYVHFKQPNVFGEQGLLLKPFSWETWICIALMWITIISALQFIRYLNSICDSLHRRQTFVSSLGEDALWAIASICGRSYKFQTEVGAGTGINILLICGIQFGTIILSIYSGLIVSALTVKTDSIKTFHDLLSHGFSIHGRNEISFSGFAKDAKETQELFDFSKNHFKNGEEESASEVITDESYTTAFIETLGYFHRMVRKLNHSEDEMCQVSDFKTERRFPVAMYVKKGSALKEILNQKMLLIGQTGLKFRYLKHAVDIAIPYCDPIKYPPQPLTLSNMRAVIWLTIVAYVVILAFLVFEIIANYWQGVKK